MEKKGNKTYYFTASLNPAESCRDFNPGELLLGDDYRLDVFFNGITIWNPNIKANFVKVFPFVRETFELIIALFTFREQITSGKIFRLDFDLQKCIEAMNIKAIHNLIWTLDYPGKIYTPNTRAKVNVSWRRVAKVFPKVNQNIQYKLILKDYMACIKDPGDNAFFFAFRIVEDLKNAINLEKEINDEKDWQALHLALKTDKELIAPLTEVAVKVRHGDLKSMVLKKARQERKRKKIIGIAIELMKREFNRKFRGFL